MKEIIKKMDVRLYVAEDGKEFHLEYQCKDHEERLVNSEIEKTFFKQDLPEKYHDIFGNVIYYIKNKEELKYINKKHHFREIDGKYNHYNDGKGLNKTGWFIIREIREDGDIEKHVYSFDYIVNETKSGIEFIEKIIMTKELKDTNNDS